jgi:hypothetical protein
MFLSIFRIKGANCIFQLRQCPFSFGHCVVCPSIYGFWLPLWYLQTLLQQNPLLLNCGSLILVCWRWSFSGIYSEVKVMHWLFVIENCGYIILHWRNWKIQLAPLILKILSNMRSHFVYNSRCCYDGQHQWWFL